MEINVVVALLMVVLGSGGVACSQPPEPSQENRVLEAWLTCEECSNGELQSVVRLGQPIIARLTDALGKGPEQVALDAARRRLALTYQSMVEYARTHPEAPVPMSEAQFVDRHLENFIVIYQSRAATALGAIGGPVAKTALTQALSLPLRPQVLAVVRESLRRL